MDGRIVLSKEDARKCLVDGERIHTFRGTGFTMIGANWDREDILTTIEEYDVEISGEIAQSMKHGICLKDHHGWLFIETKPSEIESAEGQKESKK